MTRSIIAIMGAHNLTLDELRHEYELLRHGYELLRHEYELLGSSIAGIMQRVQDETEDGFDQQLTDAYDKGWSDGKKAGYAECQHDHGLI